MDEAFSPVPSVGVCHYCQTFLSSSLLCDEETRTVFNQLLACSSCLPIIKGLSCNDNHKGSLNFYLIADAAGGVSDVIGWIQTHRVR